MSPVPGASDIEAKYQYWIDFGAKEERNRILALLDTHVAWYDNSGGIGCWGCDASDYDEHLIQLIKEETDGQN